MYPESLSFFNHQHTSCVAASLEVACSCTALAARGPQRVVGAPTRNDGGVLAMDGDRVALCVRESGVGRGWLVRLMCGLIIINPDAWLAAVHRSMLLLSMAMDQ